MKLVENHPPLWIRHIGDAQILRSHRPNHEGLAHSTDSSPHWKPLAVQWSGVIFSDLNMGGFCFPQKITTPKTNMSPQKINGWKMYFLQKIVPFFGDVSLVFNGCIGQKISGQIFGPPSPPWDVDVDIPLDGEACTSMIQMSNESVQQHIQVWVRKNDRSFGPPNGGGLVREIPETFKRNLGWWNSIIWPDGWWIPVLNGCRLHTENRRMWWKW